MHPLVRRSGEGPGKVIGDLTVPDKSALAGNFPLPGRECRSENPPLAKRALLRPLAVVAGYGNPFDAPRTVIMAKARRPLIKRSLLSSAIALATAGIAQDVYAVDLCTTATTAVSTASAADNCDITDASGSLTVAGGGTIGQGVTVNATGVTVSNAGTISGTTTALYYNNDLSATLTNSGTVSVDGTSNGVSVYAVNINAAITGTVNNSGTISATSTADATTNYQTPASAYGFYASSMSGAGALTNTGTISATATSANPSSVYYWNWANALDIGSMAGTALITNNGTISAEATAVQGWAEAYAVDLGAMSGDAKLQNNNLITATVNSTGADSSLWRGGSAYGIYQSGGLSNNASIVNAGTIDLDVNGSSWVSGYGIYTGSLADAAQVSNTGTVRVTVSSHSLLNSSTGSAGYAYGIRTGSLAGTSSVSNSGLIDVSMDGSTWGYAYGMYFDNGASGTAAITNSGTIKAAVVSSNEFQTSSVSGGSAYGIYVSGSLTGDATLTNSGVINASVTGNTWVDVYGIYVSTLDGNAQVSNTNTGSITVRGSSHNTATSSYSGGSVYGILVSNTNGAASISNSGLIDLAIDGSTWVSGYGIATWNMSGTGNSISNSGTIRVSAVSDATQGTTASGGSVYGIYAYSNSATDASVVNSGVIDLSITGKTWVSGTGIYVGGTLNGASEVTNSGTINVRAVSHNDMTSSGSGGSVYGIYAGTLNGTTAVTNSGSINLSIEGSTWVSGYGIYTSTVGAGASVSNSGTINVVGVSNPIYNNTTSSDVSGGSVYGIYTGSLGAAASVANSGIINLSITGQTWVSATGIRTSSLTDASVTNSGTITARAVSHNAYTSSGSGGSVIGIRTSTLNGASSVTNSGTIDLYVEGSSWVSGTGIYVSSSLNGTSSVTNSGSINVVALSKPIYGNSESGGSVYGIRTSTLNAGTSVTNSGSINASITGETWVSAYGIYVNSSMTDATITNSGDITVRATSHDVHGNEPSGGSAYGIYVSGSLNGASSVVNSGSISATVVGDSWVSAYGFYNGWSSLWGTSSISNTGTITVSASNQDGSVSGGSVYGIHTGTLNDSASLSNSGLIDASISVETSVSAYGIYANGLNGTSSITNSGTIRLNATSLNDDTISAAGIYVNSSAGTATITNSGTIDITANGRDEGDVYGIYNDGSAAIVNTGSMNAGIYTWGNVDNSGAVTARAGSGSFINGNLTQGAGAVWTMQIGNPFDYGSLYVGGTADFTAANDFVITVAGDAQLHDGDQFDDVVWASTLVAPTGLDVSDNSLLWNFTVTEDANGFDLTAGYVGAAAALADYGVDGSFAAFLDGVIAVGQSSPYAELASALNGATVGSDLSGVLASVSPALLGAAAQATQLVTRGAGSVVDIRQGEAGESSGDGMKNYGWWLKPYFGTASQDDDGSIAGYDVDSQGFVLGFDAETSDTTRMGVAVASSTAEADGSGAQLDIAATQLIVYGAYALDDRTDLNMRLGYGMNAYDSDRNVVLTGDVASADYDGTQLSLGADWTRAIKKGEKNTFVPSIGLLYSKVDIDGYSERGAGVYNMQARDSDDDVLLISANAGFEHAIAKNRVFLANLGLAFDTSTDAASVTTTMAGGGATYTVNGIEQDSTILMAGAGYRYITARGTEISANYDLEARSDFMANTVSVKFKMPF